MNKTVKGWVYPCDIFIEEFTLVRYNAKGGQPVYSNKLEFFDTKEDLENSGINNDCYCGNLCKPIKITINMGLCDE